MKTAALRCVTILITILTLGFSVPGTAIASEEEDRGGHQPFDQMEGVQPDDMQRTGSQADQGIEPDQNEYDDNTEYEEGWTEEDVEEP